MSTENLTREVYRGTKPERFPEIFCFNNGGSPGWYSVQALSEDGEFLAGHICSHPAYGPNDMGISTDWKHENYFERYPDGFRLVWVEGNPKDDPRIMAAYQKHLDAGDGGTPWQREHNKKQGDGQPSVVVEVRTENP